MAQHGPTPPPVPTPNPFMKSSWPRSQGGREGAGGGRGGQPRAAPGTGTDSLSLHLAGAPGLCAEGLVSPGVPFSVSEPGGALQCRDRAGGSALGERL